MGGDEKTQEVLELVDVIELGAEGLTKIREEAIELEKSAYERSKDVYGLTSPLEFEK
jgi:hypothetical protein